MSRLTRLFDHFVPIASEARTVAVGSILLPADLDATVGNPDVTHRPSKDPINKVFEGPGLFIAQLADP